MYLDKELILSGGQAVADGDASENGLDLERGDIGPSENMSLVLIPEGYGGNGSLVAHIRTSAELTAAKELYDPVTVASLVLENEALLAGEQAAVRMPHNMKRYMDLLYEVPAGTIAGGSVQAFLVRDVQASNFDHA